MHLFCAWWPWSKNRKRAESVALQANKEADQMHAEAIKRAGAVEHQAKRIQTMNDLNHYSESLTKAFGGLL